MYKFQANPCSDWIWYMICKWPYPHTLNVEIKHTSKKVDDFGKILILQSSWNWGASKSNSRERAISKSNGNRRISKIMLINPDNKHSLFQSISTIK